ncbi:hypothetical protein HDU91_005777, partial [Kappamyces sp. JEL0680]
TLVLPPIPVVVSRSNSNRDMASALSSGPSSSNNSKNSLQQDGTSMEARLSHLEQTIELKIQSRTHSLSKGTNHVRLHSMEVDSPLKRASPLALTPISATLPSFSSELKSDTIAILQNPFKGRTL